jgi:hypothetical protein
MINALGASGSNRETITTRRVFAAKPRSASQIPPGRGFIQDVQNFLLAGPGTQQVERVLIRQSNNFAHAFTHLIGRLRLPLMQSGVQRFKQGFHQDYTSKTFYAVPVRRDKVNRRDPRFPKRGWKITPVKLGVTSIFLTDNGPAGQDGILRHMGNRPGSSCPVPSRKRIGSTPAKPLEIKPVDPTFASFGRIAVSRAIQLRSIDKRKK